MLQIQELVIVEYFVSLEGGDQWKVYHTGLTEVSLDGFSIGVALSNKNGEVSMFTPNTIINWIAVCTLK